MKKLFLLTVSVAFTAYSAVAQLNPMSPIPADQEVRVGKLENGMTYYIRHNEKPKGQADFYILHNVGAIQENDAQQGLAHFLEHMAFNGTKNLPGKMLTEYLEKVGVKFGANLNAATGFDHTIYNISDVPTSRQGITDSAMLILHDWSHFIALQPEEIDSERGVISEELRTRDGASFRSMIKMIQAIGKGSKYEHRNLIGYLDGLKSFKHQELVDFYNQWYRPDYQAVVIVGDLDVNATEAQLKTLMSDIPAPIAAASQKEEISVPNNEAPIVSIYTDPEMQGTRVQMFIKRSALPAQYQNLVYGEMFNIMQQFITSMSNARLQEIAMQPDAPFLGAGTSSGSIGIIPTMEAMVFVAMTQDGKLNRGFEALYTEAEKIRRFGFTQGEFERAQEDMLRRAERSYNNRNDRENETFVNSYVDNYTTNTAIPTAEDEWQLDSLLIKNLNVEAINTLAKQVITPTNQVLVVTAPEKEGLTAPTEAELLAIRDKVANSEVAAYEDNVVKEPLIAEGTILKGSPVKKTATDSQLGTTEWTLKNGIVVVVKPTTYKADEVRLNAQAKGGLSVLTNDEFDLGDMMPSINSMSGVGKFSATELKKQLSGKTASVQTGTGNYTSVIDGVSSPKDVETMLQLLYLNFTQPRFDENDYNTLVKMVRSQLDNYESNPDYQMQKRVTDVMYAGNPRRHLLTNEIIDKTFSFEKLPAIYKKLFPNANSFVFTIVGNVDLETLKPLVEKYIGSLPVSKKMTFVDDNASPIKGTLTEDFRVKMQQPKVSVAYMLTGEMPYSIKNRQTLSFLAQTLSTRYLTSIREEKGGTYGVRVQQSTSHLPKENYNLTISFDTNEQMADELCEIIMQEIEEIAANGPKSEDIEKIREFMLKDWNNMLEQNRGWMQFINQKYNTGLNYIAENELTLRNITNADVQAMAKMLLDNKNLIKVVMRPEAAEK